MLLVRNTLFENPWHVSQLKRRFYPEATAIILGLSPGLLAGDGPVRLVLLMGSGELSRAGGGTAGRRSPSKNNTGHALGTAARCAVRTSRSASGIRGRLRGWALSRCDVAELLGNPGNLSGNGVFWRARESAAFPSSLIYDFSSAIEATFCWQDS